MCEQPHGWMALPCWLTNDYWVARAVLLVLVAVALSLIAGVLARVLPLFRMDPDDIRRLPRSESERIMRGAGAALTPDEPQAPR